MTSLRSGVRVVGCRFPGMKAAFSTLSDTAAEKVVREKILESNEPLRLDLGGQLDALTIRYATWGLDDVRKRERTILLCPSMSNTPFPVDSAADGERGWWNHIVGHGSSFGIDLDKYAVVCASPLGSPHGSSSPIVGPPPWTRLPNHHAEGYGSRARAIARPSFN